MSESIGEVSVQNRVEAIKNNAKAMTDGMTTPRSARDRPIPSPRATSTPQGKKTTAKSVASRIAQIQKETASGKVTTKASSPAVATKVASKSAIAPTTIKTSLPSASTATHHINDSQQSSIDSALSGTATKDKIENVKLRKVAGGEAGEDGNKSKPAIKSAIALEIEEQLERERAAKVLAAEQEQRRLLAANSNTAVSSAANKGNAVDSTPVTVSAPSVATTITAATTEKVAPEVVKMTESSPVVVIPAVEEKASAASVVTEPSAPTPAVKSSWSIADRIAAWMAPSTAAAAASGSVKRSLTTSSSFKTSTSTTNSTPATAVTPTPAVAVEPTVATVPVASAVIAAAEAKDMRENELVEATEKVNIAERMAMFSKNNNSSNNDTNSKDVQDKVASVTSSPSRKSVTTLSQPSTATSAAAAASVSAVTSTPFIPSAEETVKVSDRINMLKKEAESHTSNNADVITLMAAGDPNNMTACLLADDHLSSHSPDSSGSGSGTSSTGSSFHQPKNQFQIIIDKLQQNQGKLALLSDNNSSDFHNSVSQALLKEEDNHNADADIVTEVVLNNSNLISIRDDNFDLLAKSIRNNPYIKNIELVNVNMKDLHCLVLVEAIATCRNLLKLNVETNSLTTVGIEAIAHMVETHPSLTELRVANQRMAIGIEAERALANALSQNTNIKRLSHAFRETFVQTYVDKYIQRNIDLQRKQRVQTESGANSGANSNAGSRRNSAPSSPARNANNVVANTPYPFPNPNNISPEKKRTIDVPSSSSSGNVLTPTKHIQQAQAQVQESIKEVNKFDLNSTNNTNTHNNNNNSNNYSLSTDSALNSPITSGRMSESAASVSVSYKVYDSATDTRDVHNYNDIHDTMTGNSVSNDLLTNTNTMNNASTNAVAVATTAAADTVSDHTAHDYHSPEMVETTENMSIAERLAVIKSNQKVKVAVVVPEEEKINVAARLSMLKSETAKKVEPIVAGSGERVSVAERLAMLKSNNSSNTTSPMKTLPEGSTVKPSSVSAVKLARRSVATLPSSTTAAAALSVDTSAMANKSISAPTTPTKESSSSAVNINSISTALRTATTEPELVKTETATIRAVTPVKSSALSAVNATTSVLPVISSPLKPRAVSPAPVVASPVRSVTPVKATPLPVVGSTATSLASPLKPRAVSPAPATTKATPVTVASPLTLIKPAFVPAAVVSTPTAEPVAIVSDKPLTIAERMALLKKAEATSASSETTPGKANNTNKSSAIANLGKNINLGGLLPGAKPPASLLSKSASMYDSSTSGSESGGSGMIKQPPRGGMPMMGMVGMPGMMSAGNSGDVKANVLKKSASVGGMTESGDMRHVNLNRPTSFHLRTKARPKHVAAFGLLNQQDELEYGSDIASLIPIHSSGNSSMNNHGSSAHTILATVHEQKRKHVDDADGTSHNIINNSATDINENDEEENEEGGNSGSSSNIISSDNDNNDVTPRRKSVKIDLLSDTSSSHVE